MDESYFSGVCLRMPACTVTVLFRQITRKIAMAYGATARLHNILLLQCSYTALPSCAVTSY